MLNFLNKILQIYKIEKRDMLNTFGQSLIIWQPAIETWAQEMNGGPGNELGARELNSSPTLEIIL